MNIFLKTLLISTSVLLFSGCGSDNSHFTNVNSAPVSKDFNTTLNEDSSSTFKLDATDIDDDNLTYSIVSNPSHGTVSISGDKATYTPEANYNGSDSFTFKANDGTEDSNEATVSITVNSVNDIPVASNGTATTNEDSQIVITLVATDDDADILTYSIVSNPSHGTISISGDKATYTPETNYYGSDSFTFKANDGTEDSNEATVSITVNSVNDAPVASNGTATTNEDSQTVITLVATDGDGDTLTYSVASNPSHGTVSINGDKATYTPETNYYGSDSFTFKANDGTEDSNEATVSITVNNINDAPVASKGTATTNEDSQTVITLVATDDDGDTLTYLIVSNPSHGTVSISGDKATYTPEANYNGSDSFTFKANDGTSDSNEATISITVNSVNDAPVALNNSGNVTTSESIDITLTATDEEGDTLTYSIVSQPTEGTVSLNGNIATYTANDSDENNDTFTFKANDGTDDSNIATITINLNHNPEIGNLRIPYFKENSLDSYIFPASDSDGDDLTFTLEFLDDSNNTIATPDWVSFNSTTGELSGKPPFRSPHSYNIRISVEDGKNGHDSETNSLVITDYNPFITTWKTNNPGNSDDNTITLYVSSIGDNLIEWGDGDFEENVDGILSHTYSSIGEYEVKIYNVSDFSVTVDDSPKILTVEKWGENEWTSFVKSFQRAINLDIPAEDIPNLNNVKSFASAFYDCKNLVWNDSINFWKMSSVENLRFMFYGAEKFNQPLNKWDISNVTTLEMLFYSAKSFNQPLNDWNTSKVINLDGTFNQAIIFNQDINSWDVSNVQDMSATFMSASDFNQSLDNWNTSNVKDMSNLFFWTNFDNPSISNWDTSSVENMHAVFTYSKFNQPLNWDTSNVTDMSRMFNGATSFNQNINDWDTTNVKDMIEMFYGASNFNQPLNNWDTFNVENMRKMFDGATSFNQNINNWDVSNVTDMSRMFHQTNKFNQPLNNWIVSNVVDMNRMFELSVFNQDINNWNVSNVTNMEHMFNSSRFNQPLNNWNTSAVTSMKGMLSICNFNQDISNWDVSNVTDMSYMFNDNSNFNQNINNWDVSNVTNMEGMFRLADDYNQDISGWDVSNVQNFENFLTGSAFSNNVYDLLLDNWSQLSLQENVIFDTDAKYSGNGTTAANRQSIIDNYKWTINDGGAI